MYSSLRPGKEEKEKKKRSMLTRIPPTEFPIEYQLSFKESSAGSAGSGQHPSRFFLGSQPVLSTVQHAVCSDVQFVHAVNYKAWQDAQNRSSEQNISKKGPATCFSFSSFSSSSSSSSSSLSSTSTSTTTSLSSITSFDSSHTSRFDMSNHPSNTEAALRGSMSCRVGEKGGSGGGGGGATESLQSYGSVGSVTSIIGVAEWDGQKYDIVRRKKPKNRKIARVEGNFVLEGKKSRLIRSIEDLDAAGKRSYDDAVAYFDKNPDAWPVARELINNGVVIIRPPPCKHVDVTLRRLEAFFQFSKNAYVSVQHFQVIEGRKMWYEKRIDVEYDAMMKTFHKKGFDPCKRGMVIPYKDVLTSPGQLQFTAFVMKMNILNIYPKYAQQVDEFTKHEGAKKVYDTDPVPLNENGRKRRHVQKTVKRPMGIIGAPEEGGTLMLLPNHPGLVRHMSLLRQQHIPPPLPVPVPNPVISSPTGSAPNNPFSLDRTD